MSETKSNSERAAEIARKQGTVWYQMKKSKTSYLMLAPYFILFFLLYCGSCVIVIWNVMSLR